jgi:hypothetical protein
MKNDTNGSEEKSLTSLVDKAKEVGGTVAEKAGPAVEKAMESATEFVEKAVDKAKELLANKDEDTK